MGNSKVVMVVTVECSHEMRRSVTSPAFVNCFCGCTDWLLDGGSRQEQEGFPRPTSGCAHQQRTRALSVRVHTSVLVFVRHMLV